MSTAERPFATKAEWVYDRLRQRILEGRFSPDQRLRLTELAREFQTSEMPVREALRMLHRDGLIVMHSHRGASVVNLALSEAAEVVAVRMHLELLAVEEATPLHTPETLAALARVAERMDRHGAAGEAAAFSEANRDFHRRLYAPGPNGALKQEIEDLWDRVWRVRSRSIFGLVPARMAGAQAEHRAILEAVARGDAAGAVGAMAAHRAATLAGWSAAAAAGAEPPEP
jgi:DNA-binding GntR family transcriptional regulator